ncbi:MAG: biotin--[acetyl-CoA-carboxylase] ligase, partial [Spirochaetia bacterium]
MFSTPFYVPECRSTMELADRLLESRELGFGGVVVTDHQTQGQGTHGRNWEDTPGASLLVTLILDPAWTAGLLPLRIGLAVIDMLAAQGLDGLELKWPNDCLCREQKIAGVLCRSSSRRTLAGIGVNVRAHPDDGGSTSLLRPLPGAASPGSASP